MSAWISRMWALRLRFPWKTFQHIWQLTPAFPSWEVPNISAKEQSFFLFWVFSLLYIGLVIKRSMVGQSVPWLENFLTQRTLKCCQCFMNITDVNLQTLLALISVATITLKQTWKQRKSWSKLLFMMRLLYKFMIFAFMITQAARALECLITKWAIMYVGIFTMMVSYVNI